MQPLDTLLALSLAVTAVVLAGGVFAIGWPRGGQGEVGRVTRQSWAVATATLLVCLACIVVFIVMLELIGAAVE
jgi:protein-S-isoprenylcysteine O-methyltransferase Ste14